MVREGGRKRGGEGKRERAREEKREPGVAGKVFGGERGHQSLPSGGFTGSQSSFLRSMPSLSPVVVSLCPKGRQGGEERGGEGGEGGREEGSEGVRDEGGGSE